MNFILYTLLKGIIFLFTSMALYIVHSGKSNEANWCLLIGVDCTAIGLLIYFERKKKIP
jgi:hypothetical protein